MKTFNYMVALLIIIAGIPLLTACTGYLVATAPPPPPNEIIVVAPSPRHVWVPGYYTYRSGSYVWINGSYKIPPQGKTTYVPGQWQKTSKGYKRGKGYWKH